MTSPSDPSALPETSRTARRRTVLMAVPTVAASGAAVAALRGSASAAAPASRRVRLRGDGGSTVRSAEVAVPPRPRGREARSAGVLARVDSDRFGLVALTWDGAARDDGRGLELRVRRDGTWQEWTRVRPMHHGPTEGNPEAAGARRGSDLIWVRSADAVQVRQASGRTPRGLRVVLIDPGRRAEDGRGFSPQGRAARRARKGLPTKPPMRGRRLWGADERLTSGRPTYCRRLQQVHLHHTVNSNNYSRRDVPALIRGMYSYHTRSLGWSDLGYNFLVDRFGRIWVGRGGGPNKLVRGAHTLGFNHTSVGIAVIGNHDVAAPSKKVLTAVVMLAAWKLRGADKRPIGQSKVRSEGSDRFPSGRTLWLPTIDGHRDTNETACPGGRLYARLPEIRRRAQRRFARGRRRGRVGRPRVQ